VGGLLCRSAADCSYRPSQCLAEGTPAWTGLYLNIRLLKPSEVSCFLPFDPESESDWKVQKQAAPRHLTMWFLHPPPSFIFPPSLRKKFWSFVACAVGQLDTFCSHSKCVTRKIMRIYTFWGCEAAGGSFPTFRIISFIFRVGI